LRASLSVLLSISRLSLFDSCVKFSSLLTRLLRSLETWFESESEKETLPLSSSARLEPNWDCWSDCWYLRLNRDCPVSRKPFANGLLLIFNFVMFSFCKKITNVTLDAMNTKKHILRLDSLHFEKDNFQICKKVIKCIIIIDKERKKISICIIIKICNYN